MYSSLCYLYLYPIIISECYEILGLLITVCVLAPVNKVIESLKKSFAVILARVSINGCTVLYVRLVKRVIICIYILRLVYAMQIV